MNLRRLYAVLGALLVGCATLRAFVLIDGMPPWPNGTVTLELQLGSSPTYSDGTNPNSTAIQALLAWNPSMSRVELGYVNNSGASKSKTNNKNNVFFDTAVYGSAFGDGVLAVTIGRTNASGPVEMDIIVNRNRSWDSYRGFLRAAVDLRRVLIHEMGHVLSLDHPDDHGQWVAAIMNAYVGDTDTVQQDDKDGVSSLYGHGPGNPAVPPAITSHPSNATITEGQDIWFFGSATGSALKFQWMKDGVDIPGATSPNLNLVRVTLAQAGKYSFRVSNEAGTATSGEATLVVNAAQLPTITQQPPDALAVEAGGAIILNVWASSNAAITYQWTKDGVNLPNATDPWLRFYDVTATGAGVYQATVSTVAGSVLSRACTVTIIPTKPPVITMQPSDRTVIAGASAYFEARATSAVSMTYQWTHDDAPIPGATSIYLSIISAGAADAGAYRLVATNVAGSTASQAATLTVDPLPPPPAMTLSNTQVQAGSTLSLYTWTSDSSGTTYQWFKDGVPIPGATYTSLYVNQATAADAGEYFVVATNASGSTTSTTAIVTVTGSNATAVGGWRKAVTSGDIVHFLFENPARIERFSLATQSWLSPVTLSRTPTTMAADSAGSMIVALYRTLSRIDLATGQETPLVTIDSDPQELAVHNGRIYVTSADPVYYGYRRIGSISLASPAQPTWSSGSYDIGTGLSIDRTHGRAFTLTTGISPSDITSIVLNADGSIGAVAGSPYHGAYRTGTQTHVRPDNALVFDNSGIVYAPTTLTYAGSVGPAFDAIAFGSDGASYVVRGAIVTSHDSTLHETGTIRLAQVAHFAAVHEGLLFAFSQPAGSGATITWQKREISAIVPPPALPAIAAGTLAYSPDAVMIDRDGVVMVYSRLHGNVFRWSTQEQRYLEPVALRGRPNYLAYSAESHRLYLGYADARIRAVDLADVLTERQFANAPQGIRGMCGAGARLMICDASGAWATFLTYNADGSIADSKDWRYQSRTYVWNASRSRVYHFRDDTSPNDLIYTDIGPTGTIGTSRDSPYHGEIAIQPPICLSPTGDLVLLGTGKFFNADTLTQNNALPHAVLDAAWLGTRLFTIRDTLDGAQIERWGGTNYGLDATCTLGGRCVRLFACGTNRLVAVTQKSGRMAFTLLDGDLAVRNHFVDTPDHSRVRLANLSTRADVGSGDNIIIAGFVVTGSQPKRVLVRAIGPTLERFGVSGPLADPVLTLVGSTGQIASNDNWFTPDGEALRPAFREVFAFGLADNSLDSALVATLPPGSYTAQVNSKDGSKGVALVEAYDLDADPGEPRLINISTRAVVGVGDKVLIPGLAITGTEPKRLLIRAVGPGLTRFGVAGVLDDPKLEVIDSEQTLVAVSDNWSDDNTEVTAAATSAASAFRLTAGSRDAALVATLPPGTYTVIVRGVNDTSGVALVEVYEVP